MVEKPIWKFFFQFNQGTCPWMASAIIFSGYFKKNLGGSVGQIIYREYIVFWHQNISCSLATSLPTMSQKSTRKRAIDYLCCSLGEGPAGTMLGGLGGMPNCAGTAYQINNFCWAFVGCESFRWSWHGQQFWHRYLVGLPRSSHLVNCTHFVHLHKNSPVFRKLICIYTDQLHTGQIWRSCE